ncbi:MAG: ATP-binding protein, partial [Brevundimonas sp.]|nr:ATP-binding protein [Brevundimonas sp.]
MVESDGIGKSATGEPGAGEAAQALRAILQTQYLRYLIIASWAVGLLAVVGPVIALAWFAGTLAAGALRGAVEKRISERVGSGWGLVFPAVATATTSAWATAPLLAWFSGHPFGPSLAMSLLVGGYVLVFSQLRSSPKQAMVISSPYGVAASIILGSLWGTPLFLPFLAVIPFTAAGLFVLVMMTMLREERIRAFQEHQAHLIEELETARDRANAASDAKSSFLGVISHELRTPMNGVLGALELLRQTPLDLRQRRLVKTAADSGESLMDILNDVLDHSKIEAGKLVLVNAPMSLHAVVASATALFRANAESRGLSIALQLGDNVPDGVVGDAPRLKQVLLNLLGNGVKFTEKGSVTLRLTALMRDEVASRVRFEVQDTGIGIPTLSLQTVFQPFHQVDSTRSRLRGGTGLGLA